MRVRRPIRAVFSRLLLRARREWCGYRAADEHDEFAPLHGLNPKAKDQRLSIAESWSGFRAVHRRKSAAHVRVGSKAETLSMSRCLPLFLKERTLI